MKFEIKKKEDSYYHDLTLGGPWRAFKPYQMPARHERISPLPMTVFRSKLPERVEIDKRGNPIAVYRGWPKWQIKDQLRELNNARRNQWGLRSGPGSDVVSKLSEVDEGQGS